VSSRINLNPEEIVIAEVPVVVSTVLGSCLAVVFFCCRLRIGAICHATLPQGSCHFDGKYVNQAIAYMFHYFEGLKIRPAELTVKVFGGAEMFGVTDGVGMRNQQAALEALRQLGLTPSVVDVGGNRGRRLVFFSETGDVYRKWVKRTMR